MRRLLLYIALGAAACAGCGEERQSYVPNVGDGLSSPTMSTTDVSTYISDSGYVRYHIVTPLWQMFEESQDPFWRFPDGLDLEQYDLTMHPQANIRSDSATYFSRRRLWRLDGHVVMVNVDGDSFLTSQLFWDQQKRQVYSDSFIHIVRTDRIIEGYGFTSNENMTAYTVNRPTGIIPVDRDATRSEAPAAADTAAVDTLDAAPAGGRRSAPQRASQRSGTFPGTPSAATPAQSTLHTSTTR
ncbi:MAG: LPS export ABC transporter periplasmic protein LptC [Muribaculaceae bacterium]|nr:LPS export ABC transporter periplasmic protein LptC [Muribaculaceae bacterium]